MRGIRIRPDEKGLRTALFDLEADIMQVVWKKNWPEFTVADVHRELQRRREIAYTTVMTTISRLFDKELLDRRRDGKRYVYASRLSQSEFHKAMTRKVMNSLTKLTTGDAIALLVDRVSDADKDELRQIEALIRKRRKELGQ